MQDLKLIALDAEDLTVFSAHLQDAVFRVADMIYLKGEKRFAAVLNRFDWSSTAGGRKFPEAFTRRRSGLRIERVLDAKVTAIDTTDKDAVLSLLSLGFENTADGEGPEGFIRLTFSGGGIIRLEVECVEAELRDLGATWATTQKPRHAEDDAAEGR